MKKKTEVLTSDSLIWSIARETEASRYRCIDIIYSISRCKDNTLKIRLKEELKNHRKRQVELLNIAKLLKSKNSFDKYTVCFLLETCKRSIKLYES